MTPVIFLTSLIFEYGAHEFVEEVKAYRPPGQNILLIYDECKFYIQ